MSKPDIAKPLFSWSAALKGQGDLTGMNAYKNSVLTRTEKQSQNFSKDNIVDNFNVSTGFASQTIDHFSSAANNIASIHGMSVASDPLASSFSNVKTNSETGAIEVDASIYGALDYGKSGKSFFETFGDIAGSFLNAASGKNPHAAKASAYGTAPKYSTMTNDPAQNASYGGYASTSDTWENKNSLVHSFYDTASSSNNFYDTMSARWGSKGWGSSE